MTKNTRFKERKDLCGKTNISKFEKRLCICLRDSTFILRNILEEILAFKRSHTLGKPNIEILQSVENPESLFRHRTRKNKAATSQT